MKTVKISLNSIDKVKSFVMGIFSLDLSKPIDLNIHADDNVEEIMEMLKPYLCD